MKLMNKKQAGFTLIELIIVIVILGILAVTAAPKFLDLQDDAHKASLDAIKGSIESNLNIIYGKALIEGVHEAATATVTVNGESMNLIYGYPSAIKANLDEMLELASADFTTIEASTPGDFALVWAAGSGSVTPNGASKAADKAACSVVYEKATSTTRPVITINPCNVPVDNS